MKANTIKWVFSSLTHSERHCSHLTDTFLKDSSKVLNSSLIHSFTIFCAKLGPSGFNYCRGNIRCKWKDWNVMAVITYNINKVMQGFFVICLWAAGRFYIIGSKCIWGWKPSRLYITKQGLKVTSCSVLKSKSFLHIYFILKKLLILYLRSKYLSISLSRSIYPLPRTPSSSFTYKALCRGTDIAINIENLPAVLSAHRGRINVRYQNCFPFLSAGGHKRFSLSAFLSNF